jgi:intracellular multiplication protein IcmE
MTDDHNNNFEDIEHHDTVPHEESPTTGARSNLAEAWRTKPIFKLLVVMVVAGAAIAAGTTFFGGSKQAQMSRLVNPPEMHQAAGGAASPYFIEQTKEAETQRSKEALEKGTSALPTPIGQPADINVTEKTDPMNELRGETERLKQQLAQMQQVQQQQQAQKAAQASAATPKQEQFDQALSQVMQGQMKQLMDSWAPKGIKQVEVTKVDVQQNASGGANGAAANPEAANAPGANKIEEKPLIPAGTVNYAQLLVEANSDVPAPILAQIVSGPLSGARAIGSFQVANGYNDYLVLTFTLADLHGKDYRIQALALDPDTTLAGMATEVDQRYFTRLILPAAAAFLEGFGSALSTTSSTTSTNGTTTIVSQTGPGITQGVAEGSSQAANTAAQFFQEQANVTKPLIRIAAGTPMGLFFETSVYADQGNNGSSSNAGSGCPSGTTPGYSVGGKILPIPPGGQPNGCFPTSGTSGLPGLGGGFPFMGGGTASASSDVPYPNYAGGSGGFNHSGSTYGSPYGSSPVGAPMGMGTTPYYGH